MKASEAALDAACEECDSLRAQLGGAEGPGGTSALVEELAQAKLQAAQYAYERDEARSRQALAARALERASGGGKAVAQRMTSIEVRHAPPVCGVHTSASHLLAVEE